jgi:phosphopentomutase
MRTLRRGLTFRRGSDGDDLKQSLLIMACSKIGGHAYFMANFHIVNGEIRSLSCHRQTGDLIVCFSTDRVFRIAAHEATVPRVTS